MKFKVYYEFGGHKMKSEVEAHDQKDARNKIRDKILFHRFDIVDPIQPTTTDSDILSFLNGLRK
jgi:hypothetical protein